MPLTSEDNPAMAADAEIMTRVQEVVVTLRLRVRTSGDEPQGWDWRALLDLEPTEAVEVVGSRLEGDSYLVGEDGARWTPPAMHLELECAQLTGGTGAHPCDYGYSEVPFGSFIPYEPSAPHELLAGQQFCIRVLRGLDSSEQITLQPGDTVWLLDTVPGRDYWRVYAARTAGGQCFTLSET